MQRESIKEKIIRVFILLIIILCPLTLLLCFRVVKQYKRAVVLRFGRVRRDSPAGPGIIWIVPCTDSVTFIDLRTQSFNLLPQEILTKDSVTITVDAVVYFHVVKPLFCLLNVQSHTRATELLAIAILRNILGQYTLADLLTNRESISQSVRKEIDKGTAEWGIEVERVEIKDVILPYELQKAMAAEAEGTRIAKAKIIEAEGEIKTAENLRDASKVMMEHPQTILALTKDSLTVSVDAVVFYKIVDPVQAVISVTDYKSSTHYLAATTLRNALGTRKLAEVLGNRPEVSYQVFELMKNITQEWGIQIVRVEIKDIRLPLQLQKAMAAEAESMRLANAKIIVAKAEIESAKNLQMATVIMMDNPMCMQLRYLQSLQMIAGDNTHTIVFPFSADTFKKIFGR